MKKQMLAKLVVLGMVAAMLPISALAAETDRNDDAYYNIAADITARPDRPESDSESKPVAETTESTTAAVKVETTTTSDGKVAATVAVTAQTSGSTATATMTAEAVASLATQAADSDVVVLNVSASSSATEVVAELPAAALADLASNTGADLTVASPVANITISNSDLAAVVEGATNVQISAKNDGGVITVSVLADGQPVAGVALTVAIPAAEGAVAYLVAEDGTESVIEDAEFVDGALVVTVESGAQIRIG